MKRGHPSIQGVAGISLLFLAPVVASAQETLRPTLNQFGRAGLIDMPSAESLPDAELTFSLAYFATSTRTTLAFQLTPRLSGAFRYSGIGNWRAGGVLFDRSFDIKYRFMDEGRYRPAMAIGLRDFMGTGQYSAQYIVATKNLGTNIKVTAGLGWGRLANSSTLQNINYGLGGKPNFQSWFRGKPAMFGGLEWQTPITGLRLKAEYSSDQYASENLIVGQRTSPSFIRKSPINLGFSYTTRRNLQFSGYYMHGSTVGLSVSMALNPKRPRQLFKPRTAPNQIAILQRPTVREQSAATFAISHSQATSTQFTKSLQELIVEEAAQIISADYSGTTAKVRIRNHAFIKPGEAIERTMRAMSRVLPANIDRFSVILVENDLPVSKSTMRRSDLENIGANTAGRLKFSEAITVESADLRPTNTSVVVDGVFPRINSFVTPALVPHLFDPESPVRADLRLKWHTKLDIAPGFSATASVSASIAGNISDNQRGSNSRIRRVRTDLNLYQQNSGVTIDRLTVDYLTKFSPDVYARFNAGIFEQMYGGVSAEVLWAPVNKRFALGAEVSWVKQRDFDQRLKFRNYSIVTGHVSAYWDIGNSYYGQLDVGRYLAGDFGATVTLERRFANGWRVGAFATLTTVSPTDFGEGSFDKGINITIPFEWLSGKKSRARHSTTIRSITRDGGARVQVPNRLYDIVSSGNSNKVLFSW